MGDVEAICRAICKSEGINPDQVTSGLGKRFTVGQQYRLWEYWKPAAQEIMKVMVG